MDVFIRITLDCALQYVSSIFLAHGNDFTIVGLQARMICSSGLVRWADLSPILYSAIYSLIQLYSASPK